MLCWRAGIENATVLSTMLHGAMAGASPAGVRVAGMCELPEKRSAHVSWAENHSLQAGDVVKFRFAESHAPSPPIEILATDSEEYIEGQRKFAEIEKSFVPDPTPMQRDFPGLTFQCSLNASPPVLARFINSEEHILCSIDWHKWRPDSCRISLRTFGGQSPLQNVEPTEWLRGILGLGETLEVRVAV